MLSRKSGRPFSGPVTSGSWAGHPRAGAKSQLQETRRDHGRVCAELELLDVGFGTSLTGFDEPEIAFIFQSDAPQATVIVDLTLLRRSTKRDGAE